MKKVLGLLVMVFLLTAAGFGQVKLSQTVAATGINSADIIAYQVDSAGTYVWRQLAPGTLTGALNDSLASWLNNSSEILVSKSGKFYTFNLNTGAIDSTKIKDGTLTGTNVKNSTITPLKMTNMKLFAEFAPSYYSNADIYDAVKSILVRGADTNYTYMIEQIYRNHATVDDQIVMKRKHITTGSEDRFFWNLHLGNVSGVKQLNLRRNDVYSGLAYAVDITITIDYSKITDGGCIGNYGTTKMIIHPDCYQYTLQTKITRITLARYGTPGVDADYIVNAKGIQLIINSITNASESNQYELVIGEGIYSSDNLDTRAIDDFTGSFLSDEHCLITGKDFVHLIGTNREKCIIYGYIPSTGMGSGFDYSKYQPIGWNCSARLENLTVIAQNCRYAVHSEGNWSDYTNLNIEFNNVNLIHRGNTDDAAASWGSYFPFGLGESSGTHIFIKNSRLESGPGAYPIFLHTNPTAIDPIVLEYENCEFVGGTAQMYSWGTNKNDKVIVRNCNFDTHSPIVVSSIQTSYEQDADNVEISFISDVDPLPISNLGLTGKALKITSKIAGANSRVRLDPSVNSFNAFGNYQDMLARENNYLWTTHYGYSYRDGGDVLSGFAVTGVDLDSTTTGKTLGSRIGNCTVSNKTLHLWVNDTLRYVQFDQDFTNYTNFQMLTYLRSIMGSYATVEYCTPNEYYPQFNGNAVKSNSEGTAILTGMGVVFTSASQMRKALNSDGFIDGICLDDVTPGGKGRVITRGELFAANSTQRFKISEVSVAERSLGVQLGISSSTPGKFDVSASPKLLRATGTDIVKIL